MQTTWPVLQGLETLTQLRVLDVSNNRIPTVPDLSCLTQLQVRPLTLDIYLCPIEVGAVLLEGIRE